MKSPTTNLIALTCLILAVGLMVFLFAESRQDPSLRIAALVAGTGLVSSLGAIASTMLTGKDVTAKASQGEASVATTDPNALPNAQEQK